MKLLFVLAFWLLSSFRPAPQLLLLDKGLKKPIQSTTGFTMDQFWQHHFPVYADEAEAIVNATDLLVKKIETEPGCYSIDTLSTAHSMFLLLKDCDKYPSVSVILITRVDESQTSYGFTIVRDEQNMRKAQQKLLDFATYLAQ